MRRERSVNVPNGASIPNRQSINAISIAITCVVLFISVQMSDSGFATHIKTITKNLDKVLFEIMDSGKANYTDFDSNVTYKSNNSPFNPVGMAGLYNLTEAFLKAVLSEDIDVSSILAVENGDLKYKSGNESKFMMSFAGVATILIITLIFLVFMPICGLCFCCCRCCGKCGARSKPCDKKRDLCKKFCLGSLLIILTTLLLFCVVCAFASNQQFYDGLKDFPDDARTSVQDTGVYLDATNKEMEHLLIQNYNEFKDYLLETINSSSSSVMDELKNFVNASVVDEVNDIVSKSLPSIQANFESLKKDSNTMRVYASQLNDAVRKLKKDLLETLKECTQLNIKVCTDFNSNIANLQTTIDFNKLPDLSEEIKFMEDLNLGELQAIGSEGVGKLSDIQKEIGEKMQTALSEAKTTIEDAGGTIKHNLADVTNATISFNTTITDHTYKNLDKADNYIKQYGSYWYYSGLGMGCVLLLITLCIAFGLICGICGKRPDGYSDNCCNKGTGSQFLICAVMFMFLAGFLFAVFSLFAFSLGLFPQRIICYPMRNPSNSKVLNLIDDAFDFKKLADVNVTLKELLENCSQNKSAYNVFNLQSKFDLDEAIKNFDVNQTLDSINLDNVFPKENITLLSSDSETKLIALKALPYDDLSSFTDELNQNFTNYNLGALQTELTDLIDKLTTMNNGPLGGQLTGVINSLEVTRLHVEVYNRKLVEPMTNLSKEVIDVANNLTETLKLGHANFSDGIDHIINELKSTQDALNSEGKEALKNITNKFIESVKDLINTYTNRIVHQTKNDIGKCGPLSAVINATLISTCDKVLTPLTGFWFSLFASVILFFPTIIVSVKLANLYQKFKSNGLYVEAEYLYDAYAERDSIPLNSRGDKRNKKKTKKQKRYEERPNVAGDVVNRDYPGGSHGSDARYADMAPKQWEEFPAGGPPQYQRAPEYERPPPYYYPGASDQQ